MGTVRFLLNGDEVALEDPAPTTTLLDWLREGRGLRGTKEGCNEGDCGACTVALTSVAGEGLTHRSVNACILFLPQLHGKSVRTVEGIAGPAGELHPVQRAMIDHHGSQCGFCTPGVVMSLFVAHRQGRRDFDDVLAGNLCRCTGYAPIIRAAEAAADMPQPAWLVDEAARLRALDDGGDLELEGGFVPASVDSFAEWYETHPDAVIVGGATDVGLWVTKRLQRLSPVVFFHRLAELAEIAPEDGGLRIGAAVTVADLKHAVAARHPDLAELFRRYASVQVRNSATIGGNIANGSPIGDGPPALIVLGATLTLRKGKTRREMPLEDFFVDYGKQDRAAGEFVESIFLPDQPDTFRAYKISKRFDQDISAVLGCFSITVEDGTVTSARIAFGGMAATPKRARSVEAALIGQPWNEVSVTAALASFAEDFAPISDMRASAGYRLTVARNLLRRYFVEMSDPSVETRLVGEGAA